MVMLSLPEGGAMVLWFGYFSLYVCVGVCQVTYNSLLSSLLFNIFMNLLVGLVERSGLCASQHIGDISLYHAVSSDPKEATESSNGLNEGRPSAAPSRQEGGSVGWSLFLSGRQFITCVGCMFSEMTNLQLGCSPVIPRYRQQLGASFTSFRWYGVESFPS